MQKIINSITNIFKNNFHSYDGLITYCKNEYKDNWEFVYEYVKKKKRFPYKF